MQPLWERYRPKTWADVIGQEKVKKQIDTLRGRGLSGRAWWISGASGTGKSTIANLIAAEIAGEWFVSEIDAGDLTPAALKEIERTMYLSAWTKEGKTGRAYIINEAHGLRKDTVRQLLVLLERLPSKSVMIFTTTNEGQTTFEGLDDSSPLLSRCIELQLTNQGLAAPFAKRAKEIAEIEGLDGQPVEKYIALVKQCRNNMRQVLSEIEKGIMVK